VFDVGRGVADGDERGEVSSEEEYEGDGGEKSSRLDELLMRGSNGDLIFSLFVD